MDGLRLRRRRLVYVLRVGGLRGGGARGGRQAAQKQASAGLHANLDGESDGLNASGCAHNGARERSDPQDGAARGRTRTADTWRSVHRCGARDPSPMNRHIHDVRRCGREGDPGGIAAGAAAQKSGGVTRVVVIAAMRCALPRGATLRRLPLVTGRRRRWLLAAHLTDDTHCGSHRDQQRKHECDRPNHHRPSRIITHYRWAFRSRSAFPMTDTELNVMAALAIIGLSSNPKVGYSTPAATGTPRTL
jgi:hypothetical protein